MPRFTSGIHLIGLTAMKNWKNNQPNQKSFTVKGYGCHTVFLVCYLPGVADIDPVSNRYQKTVFGNSHGF